LSGGKNLYLNNRLRFRPSFGNFRIKNNFLAGVSSLELLVLLVQAKSRSDSLIPLKK